MTCNNAEVISCIIIFTHAPCNNKRRSNIIEEIQLLNDSCRFAQLMKTGRTNRADNKLCGPFRRYEN